MRINIVLFGDVKDFLSVDNSESSFWTEVDERTAIEDVLNKLKAPPDLGVLTVVNGQVRQLGYRLHDGDEVLIIPPISGG